MLNGLTERYGMDSCPQTAIQDQQFVYGSDVSVAKSEQKKNKIVQLDESFELDKDFIVEHWKYLALVLDRFFFSLYFVLIVVSLGALFPWHSQHQIVAE